MASRQNNLSFSQPGRINLRVLVFLALVLTPVGFILWHFVDATLSAGIKEREDERFGQYAQVDLKTISLFEMPQFRARDEHIPAEFRQLDGRRVMLIGEVYAPQIVRGRVTDFDLVYSISKCCLVESPKIQHFVKSTVPEGREIHVEYGRTYRMVGTLSVGVEMDPDTGVVTSVYRLEVEHAEPRRWR